MSMFLTLVLPLSLAGLPPGAAAPDLPRTAGIHAILAIDVAGGPAGTGLNAMLVENLLKEIRDAGIDVTVDTIPPARLTPAGVLSQIDRIDPRRVQGKTFLFYYAGHGAFDPRSGQHYLLLRNQALFRSQLVNALRAKRPPLTLVVTDSCSVSAQAPPTPAAPGFVLSRPLVANLLLQHRGVVDLNASTAKPEAGIYQAAFYDPNSGGLFTQGFTSMFYDAPGPEGHQRPGLPERLRSFDLDADSFIGWDEALELLRADLFGRFKNFRGSVTAGQIRFVRPDDLQRMQTQASQDPQAYGPLAWRSDRTGPVQAPTPAPARRNYVGLTLRDLPSGAGVLVEGIAPGSPATIADRRREDEDVELPTGMQLNDTIRWANGRRVLSLSGFFDIRDRVPAGSPMTLRGEEGITGRQTRYEATVIPLPAP